MDKFDIYYLEYMLNRSSECSVVDFIEMKKYIVDVFKNCVRSVLPDSLIKKTLTFDNNSKTLCVRDQKFNISKNVYIVGFGKAVLGMAIEIEKKLNGLMKKAVVSVPFGTQFDLKNSKICVMEAAKNNIPDQHSVENTNFITNFIANLHEEDVLIILISGGGSALLCSPTTTLSDKILTTKLLISNGASIKQLNSVRKALSNVKGGKLMNFVNNSIVISLILSDVVGDSSLSAIASGPTVPNNDLNTLPMEIINNFNLQAKIPLSVFNMLKKHEFCMNSTMNKSVHNILLGDNTIALDALSTFTHSDYVGVQLTKSLQGNVTLVSTFYSNLILYVCNLYINKKDTDKVLKNKLKLDIFGIDKDININLLTNKVIEASASRRGLCIYSGGEPTVNVQGYGLGGRNQELALRISANLEKDSHRLKQLNVLFFSGATDGIDGPTDACGAFGYPDLVETAKSQGLDPSEFIKNNDSYKFYSIFNKGKDLIKIGHTGTNVMDLHILIIKPK